MSKRTLLVASLALAVCMGGLVSMSFADLALSSESKGQAGPYSLSEAPPHLIGDPADASGTPRAASCGTTTVTQNTDDTTIVAGSVSCGAGGVAAENAYARCFNAPLDAAGFLLECVDLGIQTNDVAFTADLAITVGPGLCATIGSQSWGTLTPTLITTVNVPVVVTPPGAIVTHNLITPIAVGVGDDVVIEFHHADRDLAAGGDGGGLWIGSNAAGESGPSYLSAAACGIGTYTSFGAIQFPGVHWVVRLGGGLLNATGACCTDLPAPGGCVEGVAQSACLGPNQRFLVGAGQCGNFVPACGGVPANDDCNTKVVLGQQSECVVFDNSIASEQVIPGSCINPFYKDLWYTYTVPATIPASTGGELVVSTIGSSFDTILSVYDMSFITQNSVCTGASFDIACNDNIDDTFNHLSYLVVSGVNPGQVFKIRVGGNAANQAGPGMLNIDYIPTTGPTGVEWAGFASPTGVGRCCIPGTPETCQITNQTDMGFLTGPNCAALGGYFRGETDFWEGIAGAPLEFQGIGCCTVPCPAMGEACYNGIDLNIGANAKLGAGAIEGTVGRAISDKLYYKYVLPAAGSALVFDTCNSDFDTVIEIFGGCNPADSRPTPLLSSGGFSLVNDDCNYGDSDGTAMGTKDANNCLSVGGEVDSCLCLTVNATPLGDGLDAGDTIIICIGAFNPDRVATGVNSVDPVRDPLSATTVSAVLNVTAVAACFVCEVDEIGANSSEAVFENNCSDGVSDRANDGCSLPGTPATHDLNLDGMPTAAPATWTVWGRSGVYIDSVHGQRADEDWYEFVVSEKVTIDVSMIAAEFLADITLYRKGDVDACQTDWVMGAVLNVPCVTWPAGFLQADICAGTYYLVVKPNIPAKPDCASVPEYLAQITLSAAAAGTCCKGDVNGDGKVDGLDIQSWVDYFLNPPGVSGAGNTYDLCNDRAFCAVDADDDGTLTMADLASFVALLLNPPTCDPLSANCDDPQACQMPNQSGQTTSDKNPSVNAGATLLDIRSADNFMANETGDIASLCWWGFGWDGAAGFADCGGNMAMNFTATYWTSATTAGGLPCPSTLLAGPLAITGVTRVDNGTVNAFGDIEYKFTGTHAPVGVVAGQCYWVEIANNTTGTDCFFLWSYSGDGDGVFAQHQGAGDPTTYDCNTELFANDMAFCVDVRVAPNGCAGEPLVGACCLVDGSTCVMVTLAECQMLYNWLSWDSTAVCGTDCCDAALCTVSCQVGDISEAEGCGFHKNDGCDSNATAPPMEALGLIGAPDSVTVCGELFSDFPSGGDYDGDWWSFTTTAVAQFSFTFETESSVDFYLLDQAGLDCANVGANLVDLIGDGTGVGVFAVTPTRCLGTTVFEVVLPVGNYIAVIEGSSTDTDLCGGFPDSAYRLTIDTSSDLTVDLFPNCPGGGIPENDVDCGQSVATSDQNGGCNLPTPLFDTIACNTTVCGTTAFDGTTRDIDWFLFTVPGVAGESQWVTLTFQAEFDLLVSIGSTPYIDCTNDGTTWLLQKSKYDPTPLELTQCLAPGTYLVLVTIQFPGDGVTTTLCNADPGSHYTMTLDCGGACSCGQLANSCQGPGMASVTVSDVDADQSVIDDFRPTRNTVNSICWWGASDDLGTPGFQDCVAPTADNFVVTFYGDDGVAGPDTANVLGTYTLTGAGLTKTNSGQTFNTAVLYEYSAALTPALDVSAAVTAGQCVWVEIKQDNGDCGCTWYWATSEIGNGWKAVDDGTGAVTAASGDDQAFCVDNPFGADCVVTGACCDATFLCVGTMLEADCLATLTNTWTAGEDCAAFTCLAPVSDVCATAVPIICGFAGTFDNTNLTGPDAGDPTGSCDFNGGGSPIQHSAWYKFTWDGANGTTATLNTCNTPATGAAENMIVVYTGTCGAFTEFACSEDACGNNGWMAQVNMTGLVHGTTYYVIIGSVFADVGEQLLEFTCP